jgi:small subunit ribosomal protein S13
LDDTSKSDEEMAKEPSKEVGDIIPVDSKSKTEQEVKDISEDKVEKKIERSEDKKEENKPEKSAESKRKKEVKKEDIRKKDKKDDFKYIVRIANTDIDGEKKLVHGLTSIKGIGVHMSVLIADETGLERDIKIGDLTDAQIEKIKLTLSNLNENTPKWMLNHRKDYETGKDIHLIGSDIDMRLRDEINIMKKIRSYKGIRHERGLPVRGQRTRANSRRGLALGVSKKREQTKK